MRTRRLAPLVILGLLHAYIGARLLPDLPAGFGVRLGGALLLLVSYALMLAGLSARSLQPRSLADRVAAAGLFAVSLFSSLFVFTLLRDFVLLAAIVALPARHVHLLESMSALLVVGIAAFITAVGFAGARRRARIVSVDVPLANLPLALQGFSIAQISDVHVGSTIKQKYVDAIVDAVNGLKADLIAVTGDLVDGSVHELSRHIAPLARLRARHGAFLVTGNHEYYSGERAWTAEFRRLGLHVLLNEHVVVSHCGAPLVVAGVTDYSAHHFNPAQRSDPAAALSGAPLGAAKILLAHQPRSATAAATAGFDLQLSGHTHGGQFWPWNLFVRFQQPFTAGLHRLNHLWVYISRGTGYWGPPNRFGAPSEITLLRLVAGPLPLPV
ncbi:MAG: metallophosphoesterase [Gammaproteobacteria bacterium]|nr:metallophosphoesterase [Gammaproteobacteria bacterium]